VGDVAENTVVFGSDIGALPRTETMYFGGWQWGTPINGNPFSASSNNFYVDQAVQSARVMVFETLYMFSLIDGQLHPLLADGPYTWNADQTVLTVKLNKDAKWSDGTPLTTEDVKATFDAHFTVASPTGAAYSQYISSVTVVDAQTVEFATNPENYNTFKLLEFLPRVYILQKAYIDKMLAEAGTDMEAFKNAACFDMPYSGPYGPAYISSQKVVLQRNDAYWGQAASMWGKLPVPKYLAHNIYASNDSTRAAFANGEIDINQQYMTNVFDMWEKDGLPISTYLNDAPYYIPASMPSIFFNTTKPGLDQQAVRDAIAYATDYEQIAQSAMSGYSPTFEAEPRSIAAPLEGEKAYVDFAQLTDLQWTGRDYERANKVLDDAGLLDTDGDKIREYNGAPLAFTLTCPKGWSDWEASLEIVAAAGAEIGLNLTTNFVEAAVWTESMQTGGFDIIMNTAAATSITAPWSRAQSLLEVQDPNAERIFWGYHRMKDDGMNALIKEAATETDPARLKEIYTEISKFVLEKKPVIYLMYRPSYFQSQNETVWTGWPEEGDATQYPPQLASGYGVGMLYSVELAQ
jgi:peptide/nickel transport system substrate-binding protein